MKLLFSLFSAAVIVMISGCYAFSTFQSAKTVENGHWQVTGSYSTISFENNGSSSHTNDNLEVMFRSGAGERSDIGIRYARLLIDDIGDYNLISFEPKFMIVRDKLSFFMPISLYFGKNVSESESFHISPGFIATFPFNKNFEASFSPRYMIYTDPNSDNLLAFNFGIGLSSNLDKWALRPELGYLFNPGNDGHYVQFGVGLSLTH